MWGGGREVGRGGGGGEGEGERVKCFFVRIS